MHRHFARLQATLRILVSSLQTTHFFILPEEQQTEAADLLKHIKENKRQKQSSEFFPFPKDIPFKDALHIMLRYGKFLANSSLRISKILSYACQTNWEQIMCLYVTGCQ